MITNGYLDEKVQKGFLSNIGGCIDHTYTLQELFDDAKVRKKTLHLTLYDLKDGFGSISQQLISHIMEYCKLPDSFKKYVSDFYRKI